LVATSRPAIDPAISTRPVMNQLIAKVSSVPRVRQLTALRTDLICVSAPRNDATRDAPLLDDAKLACRHLLRVRRMACAARRNTFAAAPRISLPNMGKSTETVRDYTHLAQRTPANSLIKLDNGDSRGIAGIARQVRQAKQADRASMAFGIQHRPPRRHGRHICSQMGRIWPHNGMRNRQNRPMCDCHCFRDESVFP
jgi:hypothetical protein